MPDFDLDEISIDPDEFVYACTKSEIKKLIDCLIDEGHITSASRQQIDAKDRIVRMGVTEATFEESLSSLSGRWNLLTAEEEDLIMKIAQRFM